MTGNNKRTPALVAEARRLRDEGLSFYAVGERIGVSEGTIACWLDPAKAAHRNELHRAWVARRRAGAVIADERQVPDRLPKPDSRELTGKLMGDPPPNRSALDKRGGA